MEPINREAAEGLYKEWAESIGVERINQKIVESVIAAIETGRVSFDSEKKVFTYQLRRPLHYRGREIPSLTLKKPIYSAKKFRHTSTGGMLADAIAASSGLQYEAVESMGIKDTVYAASLVNLFL